MKLFLQTIFEIVGRKAIFALLLILFQSLLGGIGVLMIVPLLGFVGITSDSGITGHINAFLSVAFDILRLPKNLVTILFIYILLVSCREILMRTQKFLNASIQHNIVQTLRNRLYVAICHAEWIFLTRTRSSDYAHTLTVDVNRLGNGANTLIQFFSTSIMLGIYVIIALCLSFTLTIITLFCSLLLLFILKNKIMASRQTGKVETGLGRRLHSIIMEHLSSMKLAKIFCAEERSIDRFKKITAMITGNMTKFVYEAATTRMWFGIISVVIMSFFIYISIEVVSISTVTLLLLLFIFTRMLPQVSSIQQNFQQLLHVQPALTSFLEIEKACKDAAENIVGNNVSPMRINDSVCFKNVSFRYRKGEGPDVLKSLSFSIPARSTTAIVGTSGSGKSTIADLLMGVLYPDCGEILIDGRPLASDLITSWRMAVAYVPQENYLLNDTVRENLLWFNPGVNEENILAALIHATARDFVERLPQGLDTLLGDRGVRLSGGERQRIALARALLMKPQLLILDEATSSLDTENERRIQESIEKLHGNLTIVIIAHRLSTIRNADQIIVVDNGEIVETGTWDELISRENGRLLELSRI